MSKEDIIVETKDNTVIITLNRPKALNALNGAVVTGIGKAVTDAVARDDVRAIIITGNGRAFAAGADISEMVDKGPDGMASISRRDHQSFGKIRNSTKPVIAAINGMALGGGLELASSCHIRIASDKAIMGQPEVALGAIPGAGGTQLLPRLIGKGAGLYYLLTGENIGAQEAHRLGLVDKVVPADELMVTALAIAKVIGRKGPVAVQLVLEAVNKGVEMDIEQAMDLEEEQQRKCGGTEDFNEGIKAFMAKKPIVFKGR